MSLKIIKAGVLDTLQDLGRYGYQHWGINPGGVMDAVSATIANALTGNDPNEAVIEIHFPTSLFLFREPALIAITGADLSATINNNPVPLLQPLLVHKNTLLQFHAVINGARAYLSVHGGFQVAPWLGSCSTNIKIVSGGSGGKILQKEDEIAFKNKIDFGPFLKEKAFIKLPWRAGSYWNEGSSNTIYVLPGHEWNLLHPGSQALFTKQSYSVTHHSDRMGYSLQSEVLSMLLNEELLSTAVNFGTLQLLPNGQLMLLAADHQTTGGYPRIAHVIRAHRHKVAQARVGDVLYFCFTDQQTAEQLYIAQQRQLQQLQDACTFRLQEIVIL